MSESKLLIIDAFAQIYRGYYAVRALSNSKNQPTNAVFALAKFLLKIYKDFPAEQGIFVFDSGKPQFRLDIAPDYKANRSPMPDDMKAQMPYIERLVKAFGWSALREVGFEADDLIAAVAQDSKCDEVLIFTNDKDMHQVVSDKIKIMASGGRQGFEERGVAEVIERFKVSPEQIVDYLAMIGDASDNIPGLQGVGKKTAEKLLSQFGSIKAMIARSDEISSAKLREKVKNSVELLEKNIRLVALKTDGCDRVWLDSEVLQLQQPDWRELAQLFTELELKSLFNEIVKLSGEELSEADFTLKENKGSGSDESDADDLFSFSASRQAGKASDAAEPPSEAAGSEQPDLFS